MNTSTCDRTPADPSSLTEALKFIAQEVPRFGGNLRSFAYSTDTPDRIVPVALRERAATVAKAVAGDSVATAAVHAILVALCAGDEWATGEVAGKFLSACRRIVLCRKIEKHPRAAKFSTLMEALWRGRFTQKQLELAQKLAAEV